MRQPLVIFAVLIVQVYSAPQFITFNDGKLGVNFGGYHAGVGLGGLLGGGAGAGGLFAEAGTPFGQSAKAGLGGSIDGSGRSAGGLYAGATAGGNVKAEAGLGGAVGAEKSSGGGYASASAGGNHASSGLGGKTSFSGSSEFAFSSKKSFEAPTIVKETEVYVAPVETIKEKKVYKEVNLEATNEISPVASAGLEANANVGVNIDAKANQPTVVVKEVYVAPPPTKVIEKHIIHTHKPHRHHLRKTAYVGGFIGGGAGFAPAPVQPAIDRRVDFGAEAGINADAGANVGGAGDVTYTKKVSVASNSGFFEDIFNIPISTLRAVSGLLTNIAGNTKVSVEKSASVQASAGAGAHVGAGAESDQISPKHASPSSASASESHISVQTPSVSKVIDDIFSIPINTLTAVNKFLGNNIGGRKRVQASQDGTGEPTKVRLGPHARRRANKQAVIVQQSNDSETERQDSN